MTRFPSAFASVATLGVALLSLGASCDEARERPTGLNVDIPDSEVRVLEPSPDAVLFADSLVSVSVEATGLLQAVEFVALSTAPVLDTLARERRDYDPPVEFTEEQFVFLMPRLISGSSVQIWAIAEDLLGSRRRSAPVGVTVVDCGVEPARCG
ncbi:MAG: hypothetical protein GWN99_10310 [Gemmatimonadetes bacterium]|uniref:Lipoprotein n=1 Tax=Candidatus Kutchimonas denitrificans TaxID=3056748 RepID=A0AAE5CAK1_9BACT|nr:hypothetical protein [Gemmatimonadota bacterium]NIR74687.1 hypothetical protein [Candidatus Kutchimonas denitrificans]NIS01437.1 hypothetical protein [Gemmatimonadota bacterium]NIT67178.1 hypothetical protein [Gemmatimonadota bacterium]NIU52352.1 hypothetical protein [Gemmatimonadota bacterium]